jgi:hypothetical protein
MQRINLSRTARLTLALHSPGVGEAIRRVIVELKHVYPSHLSIAKCRDTLRLPDLRNDN